MTSDGLQLDESAARSARFVTTHWSIVLAAGHSQSAQSTQALETLCRTYWYPLYAFVRRRGVLPEDAEDLVQEFIARLLAGRSLCNVHPAKGRFRSFLLAAMNHFLANEWDKARALKRGGGQALLSLDTAEARYRLQAADPLSPDRLFEREWALALLEQVTVHLRADYQATGKGPLFAGLHMYLTGEKGLPPYRETAEQLGVSVDALKKAVARLRRRYGEVLREKIAHTVTASIEIDDEIRFLRRTVAAP